MPKTDKIDALIQTVRELNHEVRPMLSGEIGGGSGNLAEVHAIVGAMRDRELVASHGVKNIILSNREGVEAHEIQNMMGTASAQITLDEALAIHDAADTLPTRVLMSAFASAREAILSLLRELPEEEWSTKSDLPTESGQDTINDLIDYLLEEDRKARSRINELLAIKA